MVTIPLRLPELDDESTTSDLLQRHLPESTVVKGLNNIYFKPLLALARPTGAADRSALPIAGDDAAAKAAVTAFLDTLGYDAADVGPLAEGWRFQRDTTAYAAFYAADPAGDFDVPARVDAERLRAALAARRYADA